MKKLSSSSRKGALLLTLILTLLALAVLGVAVISILSTGIQGRVNFGYANRAYYLAESGAEYVRAVRALDASLNPIGTYTLTNGDQFDVVTTALSNGVRVVSTGIALPGTDLESRRRITFIIEDTVANNVVPVGFDYDGDGKFDEDSWIVDDLGPSIKTTGPSGHEDSLDLQGGDGVGGGSIGLNWQDNPDTDLVSAWKNNGELLGYEIQMKLSPFDTEANGYSLHYMLGISFRYDPPTTYGISFLRSRTEDKNGHVVAAPLWMPQSFVDADLRGSNVYLVAWYRDNSSNINLLNYKELTAAEGMVYSDEGTHELVDYATLLVKLEETIDESGNRKNHIAAYMQNPSVYPNWSSLDDQQWPGVEGDDAFPAPVDWELIPGTEIIDYRYTSENFDPDPPDDPPSEIGIHVFYDQSGANKKFFDDFAFRMDGFGEGSGTQTQY